MFLSKLFWREIKEEFGISEYITGIGIRKGWQVALTPPMVQPTEIIFEVAPEPYNDPNCPVCGPERSIFGDAGNPFGRQ